MKKILIVDDSKTVLQVLRARLAEKGYSVLAAMDGMQGVMFAHRNEPDLIVLDYKMPAGDGSTVAQKIKLSAKTQDIPVVVFSAENMEELKPKLLAQGIVHFVKKPDIDGLISTIESLLQ